MNESPLDPPPGGGRACAVIAAAQKANTPLAVADAHDPAAPILFANVAFAELLGVGSDVLVGRTLALLGVSTLPDPADGGAFALDIATAAGRSFPAVLSMAAVNGADGGVLCWLCSLIDARGENAEAAISADGRMLRQVAHAASALMSESAAAARLAGTPDAAATIASAAVEHVQRRVDEGRA